MRNFRGFSLGALICLSGCTDPLGRFHAELKKYGYIPYTTPMEFAGTGTLIGGTPSSMSIVAHPYTCFPLEVEGTNTGLRQRDDTTLPNKSESFSISANIQAKFLDGIGSGAPSFKAGVKIDEVQRIDAQFDGVHIDYIDSVKLVDFYRSVMNETCKDYLDKVGFVIQVIAIDQMRFTFYHKMGGRIQLTLENVNQYLDFSADVQWAIEQNATLVIKTPKYVGYQLGALRRQDQGFSLMRASSTIANKWIWKSMGVFPEDGDNGMITAPVEADQFLFDLDDVPGVSTGG